MKAQLFSNRYVLAGATFAVAIGIGFVMQRGDPDPLARPTANVPAGSDQAVAPNEERQPGEAQGTASAEGPAMPAPPPTADGLTAIDFTSAPVAPQPVRGPRPLPEPPARDAGAAKPDLHAAAADDRDTPRAEAQAAPLSSCAVEMDAVARPNAIVRLSLDAACLPGARLTLHHNGLTFTAVTDDAGNLVLDVPALSPSAVFIAAFQNGEGAVAQTAVPQVEDHDRVVLQWRGAAGLQLHALERQANYGEPGHVWADAPGDLTAEDPGGFLVRLGDADAPEPLMAEIYTFPKATPFDEVSVTVEAEVTEANCARELSAQTLGVMGGKPAERHELTFFMPDCAAVGDFLVLKNLYEDSKIAAN